MPAEWQVWRNLFFVSKPFILTPLPPFIMKNALFIVALVLSLGLIAYLYFQLNAAEKRASVAEQHFADCQQVSFQLQNQLTQAKRTQQAAAAQ